MKTLIIVAAVIVVSVVFAIVMPIMIVASDADDRAGIVHGRGPAPTIPPPRPSTTAPWVYRSPATSTSTTQRTARSAPLRHLWVSSTAYCETGLMANGQPAHDGAVSSRFLPRGSRWRVIDGEFAGRVFTVEDTGSKALFDIAMPGRCAAASAYGRRMVEIEQVA